MIFGALVTHCGLDEAAAARLLGVQPRRVRRWRRSGAPASAIQALCSLQQRQFDAACAAIDAHEDAETEGPLVFDVPGDDAGAEAAGWPSRQAMVMIAVIAQTEAPDLTVTLRGPESHEDAAEPSEEPAQ
ncbi:MAG: hypothetical protein AAFW69_07535 [Pseudomonadota bacterium]